MGFIFYRTKYTIYNLPPFKNIAPVIETGSRYFKNKNMYNISNYILLLLIYALI